MYISIGKQSQLILSVLHQGWATSDDFQESVKRSSPSPTLESLSQNLNRINKVQTCPGLAKDSFSEASCLSPPEILGTTSLMCGGHCTQKCCVHLFYACLHSCVLIHVCIHACVPISVCVSTSLFGFMWHDQGVPHEERNLCQEGRES